MPTSTQYSLEPISRAPLANDTGALREAGWQPIATAPAGAPLLVFIPRSDRPENLPHGRAVIAYKADYGPHLKADWRYGANEDRGRQCGWPSHWMPLPTPPAALSPDDGEGK